MLIIKAVCGSGLGSSLLVEMNIKAVLEEHNVDYDSVEHTNISSFSKDGVDFVVCGIDVAPALDIDENKKIILKNILSKEELTKKLKEKIKF
jgi:PTS system ascorbate-specific IIB component